jgi:hypothetical protein
MDETPVEVVKRKRGRPRKLAPDHVAAAATEARIAEAEQAISDGIVDLAPPPSTDEEHARWMAYLDEKVTWTMPKTDTGDPVRIANQRQSWEFWPKHVYRTPRGIMMTALAQQGVNQQIESLKLHDRGQDFNLGHLSA